MSSSDGCLQLDHWMDKDQWMTKFAFLTKAKNAIFLVASFLIKECLTIKQSDFSKLYLFTINECKLTFTKCAFSYKRLTFAVFIFPYRSTQNGQ